MLSKRSTLIISGVGILWWLGLLMLNALFSPDGNCYQIYTGQCGYIFSLIEKTSSLTMLFIVFFIFSILTYRLNTGIYTSWFRFVRWWIPLSILAILVAPQYSSDWMFPVEKGSVALAMSAIFVVVSLIIIGLKFFRRPTI